MARQKLKCWRKIKVPKEAQVKIMFAHSKKFGDTISIFPPEVSINKRWSVTYPSKTRYALSFNQQFETKPQALKFANKYMKKHDKC